MQSSFFLEMFSQSRIGFVFMVFVATCCSVVTVLCLVSLLSESKRGRLTNAVLFSVLKPFAFMTAACLVCLVVLADGQLKENEDNIFIADNNLISVQTRLAKQNRAVIENAALLEDFCQGFLNEHRTNKEIIKFQQDLIKYMAAPAQPEVYGPPAPEETTK